MIRYFLFAYLCVAALIVIGFGFRGHKFKDSPFELFNDMDRQPKVSHQVSSDFFADGVATRRPVEGTVPMGFDVPVVAAADGQEPAKFAFTIADDYYNTGQIGDFFGDGMPEELTIDADFLLRGQQRYNINCAICHGVAGDGQGSVYKYGIAAAANFYLPGFADPNDPSYRPDGSYFHTITHGKGIMGKYGANITVRDRWAIIAYIRALQAANAPEETPAEPAEPVEGGGDAPAGGAENDTPSAPDTPEVEENTEPAEGEA